MIVFKRKSTSLSSVLQYNMARMMSALANLVKSTAAGGKAYKASSYQ